MDIPCVCREPGNRLSLSRLSYHPMDVIFLLLEIPLIKMPKSRTLGFAQRFTYKSLLLNDIFYSLFTFLNPFSLI